MAAWWGDELFCLEVRELKGGRAVTLASQVARLPGRIDVYTLRSGAKGSVDVRGALRAMRGLCGCEYGYWNLLRAAVLHCALWRHLVPPAINDDETAAGPPFCSEAVAQAWRVGGGCDVVPNLADRITEPGDLSRSWLFEYAATLQPDEFPAAWAGDGDAGPETDRIAA